MNDNIFTYRPDAILAGEWWRLLTGHLVHLSWAHLALNAGGLLLIILVAGRTLSWRKWLAAFFLSCVLTSLGMLVFSPGIRWYVGLSGVLHGLLAAGGYGLYREGRKKAAWFIGGFLLIKIIREQLGGAAPAIGEMVGGPVAVDAHLYGAVSGLLIVCLFVAIDHFKRPLEPVADSG